MDATAVFAAVFALWVLIAYAATATINAIREEAAKTREAIQQEGDEIREALRDLESSIRSNGPLTELNDDDGQ